MIKSEKVVREMLKDRIKELDKLIKVHDIIKTTNLKELEKDIIEVKAEIDMLKNVLV